MKQARNQNYTISHKVMIPNNPEDQNITSIDLAQTRTKQGPKHYKYRFSSKVLYLVLLLLMQVFGKKNWKNPYTAWLFMVSCDGN